jgi:hypothetical protein
LDLLLLVNGEPTVAIESKIDAPLAKRSDGTNQLALYGRWLTENRNDAALLSPIVCLLTHLTPAPADFLETNGSKYGAKPKTLKWQSVAKAIKDESRMAQPDSGLRILADEFYFFLLENEMTSEHANRDDFAAAQIYVRSARRLEHTFESISKSLNSLGGPFLPGAIKDDDSIDFESSQGAIQGWKYLQAPPMKNLYFAYGILYAPQRSFSGDSIPEQNSAFLALGTDLKRERALLEKAGTGFRLLNTYVTTPDFSAWVSFKPLNAMLDPPESFADKMIDWISEVKTDVFKFVDSLADSK